MSVEATKTRLAELQAQITGVNRAYAQAPQTLPPSDLPLFVTFAGEGQYDWDALGDGLGRETRVYVMRLYVASLGQGVAGEIERLCEPFFARVRDFFAARPSLGNLAGLQLALLLSDGGAGVLRYADSEFIGIEFRLQVQEIFEVTYATNE